MLDELRQRNEAKANPTISDKDMLYYRQRMGEAGQIAPEALHDYHLPSM